MIKRYYLALWVLLALVSFSQGCDEKKSENNKETAAETDKPVEIGNEASLLLKDLAENGDYVNSNVYPSLIKATIVHESLGQNILLIDIRTSDQYSEGHIEGAINKKFEELPAYFENDITPFKFDKIIMICEDGQVSSYTTSLLRLMGYGNVYAMRWGMSAWNESFAEKGWYQGVSGQYESMLEESTNESTSELALPKLNTGKQSGEEIGQERFRILFEDGPGKAIINSDQLFNNSQDYFVINLERKDKYEDGHVPGAVRYKPDATLGFPDVMATIPLNKPVVVYCGTGHNSGFAVAYLRLFGYDAKMLKYGNNGFMYDKMLRDRSVLSWLPFTSEEINDFGVVK